VLARRVGETPDDRRGCNQHSRGPTVEAHGDIIIPMMSTAYRPIALALLALLLAQAACRSRPQPITVAENVVVVENRTSRDWRNVVITVNDHFRGGAATLAANGKLSAPLSQFQTGFGQRYDIGRRVFKVEVTATDSAGNPVRLEYGDHVKK
jgi:hypothetical protein